MEPSLRVGIRVIGIRVVTPLTPVQYNILVLKGRPLSPPL